VQRVYTLKIWIKAEDMKSLEEVIAHIQEKVANTEGVKVSNIKVHKDLW
jgi:hypothetical protein